jgi:hypothetical protein
VIGGNFSEALEETDVILDAIFGFSFHSEPRPPFDEPIRAFKRTQTPIVSVDIPSGWDVEAGNPKQLYFTPDVLVSLTAPKRGVKSFQGRHFLGGRFIPPLVSFLSCSRINALLKTIFLFFAHNACFSLSHHQWNCEILQFKASLLSLLGENPEIIIILSS